MSEQIDWFAERSPQEWATELGKADMLSQGAETEGGDPHSFKRDELPDLQLSKAEQDKRDMGIADGHFASLIWHIWKYDERECRLSDETIELMSEYWTYKKGVDHDRKI